MSQHRKICVVIVNRANYGRVKSVLRAIRESPHLTLQVIVCSSAVLEDFGDVSQIIVQDGFTIDRRLFSTVEGNSPAVMAKSTGLLMIELSTHFDWLKPDVVLTIADRYETLAVAATAAYMNIPLAHTQGGEVTGSIDERVRHAVTKLADIHFPATDLSYHNLLQMGEHPNSVWMVGCPSIDLIFDTDLNVQNFEINGHFDGLGTPINVNAPFLLVLQHPVTTEYLQGFPQIEATLDALDRLQMPTLMLWPNIDAGSDDVSRGIREFRQRCNPDWLYLLKNVSPEDYLRLLNRAAVIVGNSSSGIREGGFLGVPCVNIGSRQDGREHDYNVMTVGYDSDEIFAAIQAQLGHGRYGRSSRYGVGDAGQRIAKILETADLQVLQAQKKLYTMPTL